jgi:hypothetical protein
MTTLKVVNDKKPGSPFEGEDYVVELDRSFGGYEADDLICKVAPFFGVPLTLEIAIRKNGNLIFRKWDFSGTGNAYLHTDEVAESDPENSFIKPFTPTQEQIETVNGLFSERITFEGLRLSPGATLQHICPVDVRAEEKRIGKKIYLA